MTYVKTSPSQRDILGNNWANFSLRKLEWGEVVRVVAGLPQALFEAIRELKAVKYF